VNDTPDAAPTTRKIIHVDMDAFYASVEQRDNPALKGQPVAVGGGHRGVVAAASYEARAFGVRSAMPSVTAKKLCPQLIFVRPRFDAYRAVSHQIRAIFLDYTPHVEPLSLDEAYLEVTEDSKGIGSATRIAEQIRARIRAETGLTASAGVSYNKFLAKLASDQNKPDGLCVVTPDQGPDFVAGLPVRRFHGIGPKTAEKMATLGIETGADLRAKPLDWLHAHFGERSAAYYYDLARAICHRQVRAHRPHKSIGAERTFDMDLIEETDLVNELDRISHHAWDRIERVESRGRTVVLKVKYGDFQTITRSHSHAEPVADRKAFMATGVELLRGLLPLAKGVRLLGLTLANFGETEREETAEQAAAEAELEPVLPF
jgi:DNA polymerase IV